jgi:predicted amidophosphoribosyltransferase
MKAVIRNFFALCNHYRSIDIYFKGVYKNLRLLIKFLVYIFIPSRCIVCSKIVQNDLHICCDCKSQIEFCNNINSCVKCGLKIPSDFYSDEYTVFDNKINQGIILCDICRNAKHKHSFDYLLATTIYCDVVSKISSGLKFKSQDRNSIYCGKIIAERINQVDFATIDFITFVPITTRSIRKRKYNQACLIAKFASKYISNKPKVLYDFIIKTRDTKPQVGLNKVERLTNIKDCFMINNKYAGHKNIFVGKTILIIDDVATTLTTINEASRIIKDANFGFKMIIASTFSRVDII